MKDRKGRVRGRGRDVCMHGMRDRKEGDGEDARDEEQEGGGRMKDRKGRVRVRGRDVCMG
jgi:hypothetical protein